MASKWIRLNWTRPKTINYPKIWRTFDARDWDNDKLIEYRVQDLPESRFDDAIKHMETFYLKDEPVSQALGGWNDPQYVADYRMVCRSVLQQKLSLACFRACSDQLVGVMTHYVLTNTDSFSKEAYERCRSPKIKKMYDVDRVLTKQFNVFDFYGVSKYLYLHNLAVDTRFRGINIGLQMIETSKDFLREHDIKIAHGIFTSDFSSRLADELGFKSDMKINFDELNQLHPELGIKNIKSKQLSLRSLIV